MPLGRMLKENCMRYNDDILDQSGPGTWLEHTGLP